jgi:hypothetical protein
VSDALAWDLYQGLCKQSYTSGVRSLPVEDLFPNGTDPQMPEIYNLYSRCKHWNRLWWGGEMADQPYLLMLMFDACSSGESKYQEGMRPYLLSLHNPQKREN